jgi:hypothetical protein
VRYPTLHSPSSPTPRASRSRHRQRSAATPSSLNAAQTEKGRPLAGRPRRRPTTAALPRRAAPAGTLVSGLPAGIEEQPQVLRLPRLLLLSVGGMVRRDLPVLSPPWRRRRRGRVSGLASACTHNGRRAATWTCSMRGARPDPSRARAARSWRRSAKGRLCFFSHNNSVCCSKMYL